MRRNLEAQTTRVSICVWGLQFWAETLKPNPIVYGVHVFAPKPRSPDRQNLGPPKAKGLKWVDTGLPKPSYFTRVLASGRAGLVQGGGEGGGFTPSPLGMGLDTYDQRVDGFLNDFGPQLGGSRGVRWGSVGRLFGLLKPSCSQDGPKSPPRSPKAPPRSLLGPMFNDFGFQLNGF